MSPRRPGPEAGHGAAGRIGAGRPPRAALRKLAARVEPVRLLLLDVDGVLTDGGIYYVEGGGEMKRFNIQDGMGVDLMLRAGLKVGILTGRRSEMVARRGRELGMAVVKQGFYDKSAGLDEILAELGVSEEEIGYVGDDVQDLPVMRRVGFRAAPANAAPEVKAEADYVCGRRGGDGAVREIAEVILAVLGRLEDAIAQASRPGVAPPPGRRPSAASRSTES